ncbi:hypothetical protein MUY_001945 [Bacillus licheniformis WX-02]|nr:hypothetical protein MUY_001945 [Bacillus licheniformis WX-02]
MVVSIRTVYISISLFLKVIVELICLFVRLTCMCV